MPLIETRQGRPSGPTPQGPQRVRKQRRSANLMTDYFVTGKRTPDEARTPAARLSQALTLAPSIHPSLFPSYTSIHLYSLSPFSLSLTRSFLSSQLQSNSFDLHLRYLACAHYYCKKIIVLNPTLDSVWCGCHAWCTGRGLEQVLIKKDSLPLHFSHFFFVSLTSQSCITCFFVLLPSRTLFH